MQIEPLLAMRGSDVAFVAIVFPIMAVAVLLLVFGFMGHRRKVLAMRHKTIETLAKTQHLTPKQIDELLHPTRQIKKHGRTIFAITSWFGLMAGVMFCIYAALFAYYDSRVWWTVGFFLIFISTTLFATPVMMRELKRQGII